MAHVIRSCLMDPSFPALVEDVQKSLEALMKDGPIHDDDDDDDDNDDDDDVDDGQPR